MSKLITGLALRLLKVPPEPVVPAGARVIRVFRAAPNYFRYRLLLWGLKQAGALLALLSGLAFALTMLRGVTDPFAVFSLRAVEVFAWTAYIVQLPFSLAVLRLDFDMRWYVLMDRSLRIREGVLSVREKTMTFANIQNITVRRNPLQRILGLADVQVRSAGGASGATKGEAHVGEGLHEAYFRGVDNAEEIRNAIRERVRLHRDSGLGDPDDARAVTAGHQEPPGALGLAIPGAPAGTDVLAAARELRNEVRAWRTAT